MCLAYAWVCIPKQVQQLLPCCTYRAEEQAAVGICAARVCLQSVLHTLCRSTVLAGLLYMQGEAWADTS